MLSLEHRVSKVHHFDLKVPLPHIDLRLPLIYCSNEVLIMNPVLIQPECFIHAVPINHMTGWKLCPCES